MWRLISAYVAKQWRIASNVWPHVVVISVWRKRSRRRSNIISKRKHRIAYVAGNIYVCVSGGISISAASRGNLSQWPAYVWYGASWP